MEVQDLEQLQKMCRELEQTFLNLHVHNIQVYPNLYKSREASSFIQAQQNITDDEGFHQCFTIRASSIEGCIHKAMANYNTLKKSD